MATTMKRPGVLTALCVLTIVLAALGILGGLSGIAGLALHRQLQATVVDLQPDAETAKVQAEIAEETAELMSKHVVRNWIITIARLTMSIGLLLGGIWSLRLQARGRRTLLVLFGVGIVLEVAQIWPLLENREITAKTFDRLMQAQMQKAPQPKAPPGFNASMKVMGQVVATMQLVVMVALLVAKCGFYAFGLWYLTRPNRAALFARQTPNDPQWA